MQCEMSDAMAKTLAEDNSRRVETYSRRAEDDARRSKQLKNTAAILCKVIAKMDERNQVYSVANNLKYCIEPNITLFNRMSSFPPTDTKSLPRSFKHHHPETTYTKPSLSQ
jgi:hypothetical protein